MIWSNLDINETTYKCQKCGYVCTPNEFLHEVKVLLCTRTAKHLWEHLKKNKDMSLTEFIEVAILHTIIDSYPPTVRNMIKGCQEFFDLNPKLKTWSEKCSNDDIKPNKGE